MEQVFGVSYPTVKARRSRIARKLEFVENDPRPSRTEVIDMPQHGEITAEEAIIVLKGTP
jgi:hypothetical protein